MKLEDINFMKESVEATLKAFKRESIPEWVTSKDFVAYREYIEMPKEQIIKRCWDKQDKLKSNLVSAVFFMALFGMLAIGFEIAWLSSMGVFG